MQKVTKNIPNIIILLFSAFILRLILSPFGTLTLDQNTFIAWGNRLAIVGFSKFYFGGWSDYLPGYLYILRFVAQIANATTITQQLQTTIYKLPAILSDIGTGYLIYKITKNLKSEIWGRIAAFLYLFNPAVIANSTLWGQVDGLTAFFALLSFYTLESNFWISSAALAFGTLIKPQMALISLIIFILMIQRKWKVEKIIAYILEGAIIFIGGFLPFANGGNLINFIIERLNVSLNQYPYTSVNAFNFWAIIGTWRPDTYLNIVGGIIIAILFFAFGIKFLKQKGGEYILLAFTFAISFLFMTRMHERHLLPVFAPLTIAVAIDPIYIFALIGFSFIYSANLAWAWSWVNNNFNEIFGDGIVKLLSLINVLLLGIFIIPDRIANSVNLFLRSRKTSWPVTAFTGNSPKAASHSFLGNSQNIKKSFIFEKSEISSKKIKILFIGVVIFAAVTRFYNLPYPQTHYFDEVYHAFTAQNMLHGITKAWEWWNPNPAGFAYEWTHPPLAKEGMVIGMSILGENSFGWRFPGALLGVGSVILTFFIAKEIFDDELLALMSSAIMALDGLTLVTSRIGMNDTYMLFFALASVYSYLRKRNFLAAIFFGLSCVSKWSGLWVAPIIFVAHFVYKRKLNWSYILFFIIPPLIYVSAYFPLFTNRQIQTEYIQNTGYATRTDFKTGIVPLDMFIDTQKQMWWYHTNLRATHPYSSMWYTWPVMVRPVYLYTSDEINGQVVRIYMEGSPVVFWGGVAALVVASYLAIKERNKILGLVVFSYLVFFTPWALSPRIMFLYHYLPSIPFMAIVLAYVLRRFKDWRIPFFILAFVIFAYFYPHFAGLKIPISLDTSYYWFPSWR